MVSIKKQIKLFWNININNTLTCLWFYITTNGPYTIHNSYKYIFGVGIYTSILLVVVIISFINTKILLNLEVILKNNIQNLLNTYTIY